MRSLFPVQDSFVSQSTGQIAVKLREHGSDEMREVSKTGLWKGNPLPSDIAGLYTASKSLWSMLVANHDIISLAAQDYSVTSRFHMSIFGVLEHQHKS